MGGEIGEGFRYKFTSTSTALPRWQIWLLGFLLAVFITILCCMGGLLP